MLFLGKRYYSNSLYVNILNEGRKEFAAGSIQSPQQFVVIYQDECGYLPVYLIVTRMAHQSLST